MTLGIGHPGGRGGREGGREGGRVDLAATDFDRGAAAVAAAATAAAALLFALQKISCSGR